MNDKNGFCPFCRIKVTYRSKGVVCESCANWYHVECGNLSDDVYASITQIARFCESCCRAKNKEKYTTQVKLLLRYKDDVIRTVIDELKCVLDAAISLHPNLQFNLQEISSERILTFLDLNLNVL